MAIELDNNPKLISYIKTLTFLVGIICVILAGFVLLEMKSIIVPLVLALIISFILNPIILYFEKRHIPEIISIILVLTVTFCVLFLIAQLINLNIKSFLANINQYEERFKSILTKVLDAFTIASGAVKLGNESTQFPTISAILENISIKDIVTSILGSISSILSDSFLVLLYLLFLLIGRNKMIQKMDVAFNSDTSSKMKTIVKKINKQINKYIITKTLISLLTAALVTFTLWLFNVEFAFIWGFLTFLLNFIPNIGSIIATFFPLSFALIQFENVMIAVWIGIILLSIQFLVGNVLEPKILGQSVGISPVVVLFSLLFWGYVWGIIGMILAVPSAVLIKIILENISGLKPLSILMSDYK
jgi:predicted PurR-regulated permease PerM